MSRADRNPWLAKMCLPYLDSINICLWLHDVYKRLWRRRKGGSKKGTPHPSGIRTHNVSGDRHWLLK